MARKLSSPSIRKQNHIIKNIGSGERIRARACSFSGRALYRGDQKYKHEIINLTKKDLKVFWWGLEKVRGRSPCREVRESGEKVWKVFEKLRKSLANEEAGPNEPFEGIELSATSFHWIGFIGKVDRKL